MDETLQMLVSSILADDVLSGYTFDKIERTEHGVANMVYILKFVEKSMVLKVYRGIPIWGLPDMLECKCSKKGIPIPRYMKSGIYAGRKYVLSEFIEGKHEYEIDEHKIIKIVDLIDCIGEKVLPSMCNITIYDKINKYYETLKQLKTAKLPRDCIDTIIAKYEECISDIDRGNYAVVHGDISPTNLLWKNGTIIGVLDFDEAIIAPVEYEMAVAVIKFCKKRDLFDTVLAEKMISVYVKRNSIENINKLHSAWKLYISKVLMEKVYLHEIGEIDLFDRRQLQDNWLEWYKLINDKCICESLFKKNPYKIDVCELDRSKNFEQRNTFMKKTIEKEKLGLEAVKK